MDIGPLIDLEDVRDSMMILEEGQQASAVVRTVSEMKRAMVRDFSRGDVLLSENGCEVDVHCLLSRVYRVCIYIEDHL